MHETSGPLDTSGEFDEEFNNDYEPKIKMLGDEVFLITSKGFINIRSIDIVENKSDHIIIRYMDGYKKFVGEEFHKICAIFEDSF